ncbi:MAG: anti-sigma factor antagonist [Clostridia bacterium]|nr:anti-sigma factor antagonist [Clostridia bacterium]
MHNLKERYGTVTVALSGELDHCNASKIRRQLDDLLADEDILRLCLDLSDLTFMDSSGIGVLLGRLRILEQRGGSLAVKNMSQPIAKLFHLTGLQRVIQVENDKTGGRL